MCTEKTIDLSAIKLLILDVDGVLTDGTIIINEDGSESKRFDTQDGHGIKMWNRSGRMTAIISGRQANATSVRAEQLNIAHVIQGQKKKLPAFEGLLSQLDLRADEAAYVGDDLMDIPLVKRAGFGVAVSNGVQELKDAADYVTKASGGSGAVREVIEYILKGTNGWDALMDRYLV